MPSRSTTSRPSAFRNLGLNPELVDAIEKLDYVTPTPVQQEAIPLVLQKKDVLGCAQTGTGKTAAFALPILSNMGNRPTGKLRCLVMTPTRELAIQVAESFRSYAVGGGIQVATAIGGVEMRNQLALMKHGADVLVATPGRLMDHMYRGNVEFSALEVVVLDEADRMLDMGFIEDVEFILSCLPKERQTLLFSATLERAILDLASHHLIEPVSVDVSPHVASVAEGIRHTAFLVKATEKRELVRHLINQQRMDHVIVFTRTKIGAEKLSKYLEHTGIDVGALHSDKSQSQRIAILNGFKRGKIRVLVATDVAARGLDISTISHVINFDLPGTHEAYVHRAGRTARAGSEGDAITLVAPNERHDLNGIAQRLNIDIPYDGVPGMTMSPPSGTSRGGGRDRNAPRRGGRHGRDGRSGRDDRDRGERSARGGRGERSEPVERGVRSDRGERSERDERSRRGGRRRETGGRDREERDDRPPSWGRTASSDESSDSRRGRGRGPRRDEDHGESRSGREERPSRRDGARDASEGAPPRRGGRRPSRDRDETRDESHSRRSSRERDDRDRERDEGRSRARPERPGRREESGANRPDPRPPRGSSVTKKRFW